MTFINRLKKAWPDIAVILITLFLMLAILSFIYMLLAWTNFIGYIPSVENSVGAQTFAQDPANDRDNDLLPDVIEEAQPGEAVYDNGVLIGEGTGTNPDKKDTDGDFFTDALEDKLGTSSRNWFYPGVIWLVYLIYLFAYIYMRYIRKVDVVKEYIRKEEEIVAAEGKIAIGGSSIFANKKISDLTEEEKKMLIESDSRFQSITGFNDVRRKRRARNKGFKRLVEIFFASFIAIIIFAAILQ